jgi:hypothetical protein
MRRRASFVITVVLCAITVAAAQNKPSTPQAHKKTDVVVFTASQTPQPEQAPETPKGVPKFAPLSNEEKLKIVQGLAGLPHVANVTPFLTLTVDHMYVTGPANNPLGYLTLDYPDKVFFPLAHYAKPTQPNNSDYDFYRDFLDKEDAEIAFKVDEGAVYMADFFIAVDATHPVDFQVSLGGANSGPQAAAPGGTHLLTPPVYVNPHTAHLPPGQIWYKARLRLAPRNNQGGQQPRWGTWFFIAVEVSKFVNAR